jgi:WD40 repeat protein/DNA-binding CsgD family transcriptional regulator/transcriptional regulator with XRE-family HTH domain
MQYLLSDQTNDSTFGLLVLTLRQQADLTQVELAQIVGVTEKAVRNWEAGTDSPSESHLKKFIEICLDRGAFTPGQERAEATILWKQACQSASRRRASFDEMWFTGLLAPRTPSSQTAPRTAQSQHLIEPFNAGQRAVLRLIAKDTEGPAPRCRMDWGEASEGGTFYGRAKELAQLEKWMVTEGCRLITVLGMGGLGKTALATHLVRQLQPSFDVIFWRSLLNAPPIDDLLAEAIAFLSGPQAASEASSLSRKLESFLKALRTSRCLIVLDNVEAVLQGGSQGRVGHYRAGYEAYGTLLQLIGEAAHHSCLLLTSREKPKEVGLLEGKRSPVRSLLLPPLEEEACQQVLQDRALVGSAEAWTTLIGRYAGNPLALKLVAGTIEDVFEGSILTFLRQGGTLLGDIRELLDQQFERLSAVERDLLYWLAIEREAVTPDRLLANVVTSVSKDTLLEALDYLVRRRCWIEKGEERTALTLQPVIMQYVTDRLIEQVAEEMASESVGVLLSHALVKAQATDEVRNSQMRLVLEPLADRLLFTWGKQGVEDKVRTMLASVRKRGPRLPGYAGGNALHLLCQLKSDLSQTDFSGLAIWQAYLRGVSLRDVNVSQSDVATSVFTEAFGGVNVMAFSPDGRLLAAGTTRGELRVWHVPDGKLLLAREKHANMYVAFSPDGALFASSGNDHTIEVLDVRTWQCLSTLRGHSSWVRSIAFSSDGKTLASGSDDQSIKLWDVRTGECLSTLQGHSAYVYSVAFSPDGALLASGSQDQSVKLWDVRTGECLSTLQGHGGQVWSVAFSPDGVLLASGSDDQSVKLWDVRTGECLSTLQGHSAYVWSVAFSPDGALLASGGYDQSIKLWDVRRGHCLSTLQGHAGWVRSVTFGSDGKTLASGGYDQNVKLWDVGSGHCHSTLQGHSGYVYSVAFSPDGTLLASGSQDQSIKLWDVRSGHCHSMLQSHSGWVRSVAFSSNGKTLASGSYDQSVKLWDVRTGECLSTLQGHTNVVLSVAFSPTSALLASGSQDGTIKLWETRTGRCLSTLRGERPYERLNMSGVRGLTEAEKASLRALGAREQSAESFEKSRQDGDQLPIEPLSEREREVLRLLAQGASTQEIAQQLGVAVSTVKTYLKGIYGKLHVHSRAQAVARAAQLTIL